MKCKQKPQFETKDLDLCVIQNAYYGGTKTIHFPTIKRITLENSTFNEFNVQCFHRLPSKVQHLIITGGSIPTVVFHSVYLQTLEVSNAELTSFEVLPNRNRHLKELTIIKAKLASVTETIRFLESLESLTLQNCNLSTVNVELFAVLKNLTMLDLSENQLKTLEAGPDVRLKALTSLMLDGNRLQNMVGFPEAYPVLHHTSLNSNDWRCGWVGLVRSFIWKRGIIVQGYDRFCGKRNRNGGLCCTSEA